MEMKAGAYGFKDSGFQGRIFVIWLNLGLRGLAYLQFGALIDYLTAFFLDINTAALQISIDVDNEHLGI